MIQKKNEKLNEINKETFKVYVRIRPFLEREKFISKRNNSSSSLKIEINKPIINSIELKNIFTIENKILYVQDFENHKNDRKYIFDNIFDQYVNNKGIFEGAVKPIIKNILNGYNVTLLAYGSTGSGKTHTIFGDSAIPDSENGIIINACDYLFEEISNNKNMNIKYTIKLSYLEIYNEIVRDLLGDTNNPLMIVESSHRGIYCPNSKEFQINNSYELKNYIYEGNKKRTMASTNQNQFSSRSHAILQIMVEKSVKLSENKTDIFYSKFLTVDLAGSEKGGMEKGKRREEGGKINKSLFTLGSCINLLSDKTKAGQFIPYRDSKLTRLLKDSLGGNILTIMLACVSPNIDNYEESISTLNYATKAKEIKKLLIQNIREINNIDNYKEIIDSLKSEISQLKEVIKNQEIQLQEKNNVKINEDNSILTKKEEKSKNCFAMIKNMFEQKNINVNKYREIFEEIKSHNEFDVKYIKNISDLLQKDKRSLENYILENNINLTLKENKEIKMNYTYINEYYEKFVNFINDKLLETIEQTMILKYNMNEIIELNKINNSTLIELKLKEKNINYKEDKILITDIKNVENNIEENKLMMQKLEASLKNNLMGKNILKSILLSLLNNKSKCNIIQIDDCNLNKMDDIKKEYENRIKKFEKIQKKKDNDISKVQRQIEILQAKLKEKDRKITELKKITERQVHNKSCGGYKENYIKSQKKNSMFNFMTAYNNSNMVNQSPIKNKKEVSKNNIKKFQIKPNAKTDLHTYVNLCKKKVFTKRKNMENFKELKTQINETLNTLNEKEKNNNQDINLTENYNKISKNFNLKDLNLLPSLRKSNKTPLGNKKMSNKKELFKIDLRNSPFNEMKKNGINNYTYETNSKEYLENKLKNFDLKKSKKNDSEKKKDLKKFLSMPSFKNDCINGNNNNHILFARKLSLKEARFENKIKNIKDKSLQMNLAENFIKDYKNICFKEQKIPKPQYNCNSYMFNNNVSNNYSNNNNNLYNKNFTINIESINQTLETKEDDVTNYKTDLSNSIKVDDNLFHDIVNNFKNSKLNRFLNK